ncbi:hypothetical protein BS297_24605 [Rhodococcus erythropolis]|uniref:Uncharacterized protein n=1 Tax=Rhodococcus erythropolis TaxID=1833 RepID=A0A5N5DY21_RHOER|nr:hypothetical protein BS297_24605 [Rhodococcus erythropolis]
MPVPPEGYGDEDTLLPRVWKEWRRSRLDPGKGFLLARAGYLQLLGAPQSPAPKIEDRSSHIMRPGHQAQR